MRNKILMKLVFGVFVALITVGILQPSSVILAACQPNPAYNAFADVTGDGRADAIVVNQQGITVRRTYPKSGTVYYGEPWTYFGSNETWTSNPYYGEKGTFFADVTGEGRADAIVVNSWGITVRVSDGNRFMPNATWTPDGYYGNFLKGTYFADVTGDGRADAIRVNTVGITVRRSDGARFLGDEIWANVPSGTVYPQPIETIYFADITGNDGLADFIRVDTYGVFVRKSLGNKFEQEKNWTGMPYYGQYGTYVADVTGDGRADVIVVNSNGATVRRSTGNYPLQPNEHWNWDNKYIVPDVGTYFANIDGYSGADEIGVYTGQVYIGGPVNGGIRVAASNLPTGGRFNWGYDDNSEYWGYYSNLQSLYCA